MVGRDLALSLIEKALGFSTAEQTQVQLITGESMLTRYAENHIHQNVSESNSRLLIRVAFGKKLGSATTNDLSDEGIRRAVESACTIAQLSKENPRFSNFAYPSDQPYPEVISYSEETASLTSMERAEKVKIITDKARAAGFKAAGSLSTQVGELAIGNSHGIRAYNPSTRASISAMVMSETSAGQASDTAMNVNDVDFVGVAEKAFNKCRDSQDPVSIEAGDYEVILEPQAAGMLLSFLVRAVFNPMLMLEGRSLLKDRMGTQLLSDKLTIWDDATDPRGLPTPFDFEGIPKQKVVLIENGVAKNLVYDTFTANLSDTKSTGHATPFGMGGAPMHMFVQPGDASIDDMIKSTKKGLLITRFHYANMIHPMRVVVTGMTRDGTFLVEDGEIKAPVKNLRFTQGILEALNDIEMVGQEVFRAGQGSVPALKIGKFTFTGVTEH